MLEKTPRVFPPTIEGSQTVGIAPSSSSLVPETGFDLTPSPAEEFISDAEDFISDRDIPGKPEFTREPEEPKDFSGLFLVATRKLAEETLSVLSSSEDEQHDFIEFLRKLAEEILGVLSSPKDLAPILVELMIISPALVLCWRIIKWVENLKQNPGRKLGSRKPENPVDELIEEMGSNMGKILDHFRNDASKGRLAEISADTGISKGEVGLLLRVMAFEHQPDGHWQPPKPIADFLANQASPPNKSLQPTTLSRTFLRFVSFLKHPGSSFLSRRKPRGG